MILVGILFTPQRTFMNMIGFTAIRVAIAYACIIASLSGLILVYFQLVDFPWLRGVLIDRLGPDQRTVASAVLSPGVLMISSVAGRIVKTTVWLCLLAFVFDVAGKSFRSKRSYLEWLQLVVLSNLPLILLLPMGMMAMMLSPTVTFMPSQLDTTSLAFMFSGTYPSRWDGALSQISIIQLWIVGIQTIGIAAWLNIRKGKAFVIAVSPFLVCLASAAVLALL